MPLGLRTVGIRFHQGEAIPFTVEIPPAPAANRTYQFEGFLMSPSGPCGSLDRICHIGDPGGLFAPGYPYIEGDLNRYLPRVLAPGHYRITAIWDVEELKAATPTGRTFGYLNPRQYIVSKPAEFDVIAATPEWQRATIAAAVKTLIEGDGYEPVQMRQEAARQLRYLEIPQAWEAELDQLDKSPQELLAGLASAHDRKAVCGLMRARLTAPRQYIAEGYLDTLGTVCGTPSASSEAAATLATHLAEKAQSVQAAALDALAEFAATRESAPAWFGEVRRAVVRAWPAMPESRKKRYLSDGPWALLRGPDFAPLLDSSVDKIQDAEAWRLAIRRLDELARGKAEPRLVAEMFRSSPRLDDATLALLPAGATRNLTPQLLKALASGGNGRILLALIARYGDRESLPRIRGIFEAQADSCQPELLAYFLRVDPEYADGILHRQPWDMHARPPACASRYFAVTARLFLAPPLERFMDAYLMHGDVQTKMLDAEALGKYGTAASEKPLWDTLRYFHDYWKDRPAALKQNAEGEYLEVALRNAIARGAGWYVDEAGLRAIDGLCISERCRYETGIDLQHASAPVEVRIEGGRYAVAQYRNLESIDALERKLAQFPTGTTFRLLK